VSNHFAPITDSASSSLVRNLDGSEGKGYIQLKIHDGPNPNGESHLTMAIGDMIHSCGLPFHLASNPFFVL
jgi:hypothetical protein